MTQPTDTGIPSASAFARWSAILTGVVVLAALPTMLVLAIPRSGELGGLLIVPAVGLVVFELIAWWKPASASVASPSVVVSILFCLGAIASQLPWVMISATDVVLETYLDIVAVLVIKAAVAAGTWVLQSSQLGSGTEAAG